MKTTTQHHPNEHSFPPTRQCRLAAMFLTSALMLGSVGELCAHEDLHTHPALSVGAMLFLDLAHPEDGTLISSTNRTAIRQGSIDEDVCPNYVHHFYNPKTGQNTTLLPPQALTCDRPPGFVQQTAAGRAADFWASAVAKYRAGNSNSAFLDLGHVFHLLQDMTSPAHVHNDVHAQVGGTGCQDGDDFENWGWSPQCTDFGPFDNIYNYILDNGSSQQLTAQILIGLQRIFGNRPQLVSKRSIDANVAYSFLHVLADRVYDFTTFQVRLRDTFNGNDPGEGELKDMFPSLEETTVPAAWWIQDVGYSQGECVYTTGSAVNESWWIMPGCNQRYESLGTVYVVDGNAYIENTGGGGGGDYAIPDTVRPARYNRSWFRQRYTTPSNGQNISNVTMLRIYGDVLYPAAVAYGAGLLQAFLDEAIMPKPITDKPTQLTGVSAQLTGRVRPAGENALAWFEWGTNTSYGTTTPVLPAGAGQALVGLYAQIDDLSPNTVYHCRIVSSNRFGIRHGTNLTFRTPAFLVTGNAPNAWQITDRTNANPSTFGYLTNLTNAHRTAATNSGFRYQVIGRLVTGFNGAVSINMSYGLGTERYLIWWTLDQNGDLIANLDQAGILKLTTNGAGSASYHTHEIVYDAGSRRASYLVGGVVKTNNWAPSGFDSPAGQIAWGAGSSSGMGQMNFHKVEFQITGSGVVALYHAGYLGNPSLAPNPTTQGWTPNPASPPPLVTVAPISPDFEPYLPLVETLNASEVGLATARLNGRGDPRGESARGWFEWGTSATYGNATSARDLGDGLGWSNVVESLTGLAADQPYHYRLVVSNAFTVVFGADQTFLTTHSVTIVATAVPQPGQFRLQFTGAAGAAYEVLHSDDLSVWTSIGPAGEISAGTFEFLHADASSGSGFYQVRLAGP